jgi:hypothetical protein
MDETKIIGYKKIFGFVLPDWVSEKMIRGVVSGLLLLVVMLLTLIFVIWPSFDTLETRKLVLDKSKKELEVIQGSSQGLERIKSDLSLTDQEKILAAMPVDYSPDGAIYLLRRISAEAGVSLVSYSLPGGELLNTTSTLGSSNGSQGEMVEFVSYPLRLTVAAPVPSLLDFISKVESSLPFGVVSDLNLQEVVRLSRSAEDKTVQLAMEIKFYQSHLKSINITKLQPLTAANLSLAKELAGYNLLMVSETAELGSSPLVSTGSGNIFGF